MSPRGAGDDRNSNILFDSITERAYASMGMPDRPSHGKSSGIGEQDMVAVDSSAQLEKVLGMLPQRRTMDAILQLFLTDVNYHYYIIHPTQFLKDYYVWWEQRTSNKPISLQYTLLLAMVNAGALQHVHTELQAIVEGEVGMDSDTYSDKLHDATRELASVVPVGHYHMINVQRLLHSCYWYKAEAKFVEAWHVLSQAILEARELSMHIEQPKDAISDYEREIHRRLWCICETWDWQISSGLARPKLIEREQCTIGLPELTLEGYDPPPLLHMKLQSKLTRQLAVRFNAPKNITSPEEIQEYKDMIVNWVDTFPPEYDFYKPDTSRDDVHPWIFPHRFYLYTMACILVTNPIRTYMVKAYDWDSPTKEVEVRNVGVYYSLVLIQTLRKWVDRISTRDGRLHFIIFSIFDTAAMLCTAMLKDTAETLPRREEILESISHANLMLSRLMVISKTAKVSRDILNRLSRKLPQLGPVRSDADSKYKRNKLTAVAPSAKRATAPMAPVLAAGAGQRHQPQAQVPAQGSAMVNSAPASVNSAGHTPPVAPPAQVSPQSGGYNGTPPSVGPYGITPPPPNGYAGSNGAYRSPPDMPGHMVVSMPPGTHANLAYQSPPDANTPMQGPGPGPGLPQQLLLPSSFGTQVAEAVPAIATYWSSGNSPRPFANNGMAQPPPERTPMALNNLPVNPYAMSDNMTGIPGLNGMQNLAMQPQNFIPQGNMFPMAPISDPVPDLDLANLTEIEIGHLAPLWSWHSSNLDDAILQGEDGGYVPPGPPQM